MLKRHLRQAGLAVVTACLTFSASAACTITRTQWGPQIIGCNLAELTKGKFEGQIDRIPPRPVLSMPNLRVDDIDYWINGGGVEISIDLGNHGTGPAAAFDSLVIATVHNPLMAGAQHGPVQVLPVQSVPSLVAGGRAARSMGWLGLPSRSQDWDICVVARVDPPSAGAPRGGVWEGDENDNERSECCRVYGPFPDLSGPGACR